jgi:tight adherence protein B
MNPMLAGGAFLLLGTAVALMFFGRESRVVRDRLMAQTGRAQALAAAAAKMADDRHLLARPTERTGVMPSVTAWLGLTGVNLPLRRLPVPLVIVISLTLGGLAAWGATFLLDHAIAPVVGGAVCLVVMRGAYLWELGNHRDVAFKQIPDAIGLMVRAVRAGLPVGEAVRSVSREMPEPTKSEFERLIAETAIGTPMDRAIWGIYERTKLREYAFLSVVIGLQSQTGGSLAEALDNIGDIVRKRVAMAAKARALASQARASAGILMALPPFSGAAVSVVKPGYLDALFFDPRGHNLLGIAVVLLVIGLLVIRTMIKRATAE